MALFAVQALDARSNLYAARSDATKLSTQLADADVGGAHRTLTSLRGHTARAYDTTSGWLWDASAHLPVVGRDVAAVQTAAATLDAIAQHAAPTLLDVAGRVQSGQLSPRHGRLPLSRIAGLAPGLQRAADAVAAPAARLQRVDTAALVGPLDRDLSRLQEQVASATSALADVATAFRVLPAAAGGSGTRHYLLLFQTNAEIRATGGMAGSWAVVRADRGHLSIVRQGSAGDIDRDPPARAPVRPTAQEKALYGSDLGKQLRDANFNPDFPRFAEMSAGLVSQQTGVRLDGVFSIDPVALSFVLRGTGPVPMRTGPDLTSGNAVSRLLNTVYFELSPPAQDAYFQQAARRVFDAVASGKGDQLDVVRGLVRGVTERRVLAWSARPDLAAAIDESALAGVLTREHDSSAQVGVFFNDSTASKMEYYLRARSEVVASGCTGGRLRIHLRTTLHSTIPKHRPLPLSITGPAQYAAARTMLLDTQVYGPVRGRIDRISVDGKPEDLAGGTAATRPVVFLLPRLRPGQTVVIDSRMTAGPGQHPDIEVSTTPGIEPRPDPQVVPSTCS